MKKVLLVLLLLCLCSCYTVQASVGAEKGVINVNTTANTEIAPDVAEISFAVTTSDIKSMQKATLANKEISDKVYAELKSMIDTKNGDYIKTSDFSANPIYSYTNSKKNFEKYEPLDVEVVTVDMDRFGYYAIIKYGDEVQKKHIPISDEEADRLYTEMKYDMENANRETPILINVRKDKKDNLYSQEEYDRMSTKENPDALFYTIILIVSMIIVVKTSLKKDK